MDHFQKMRYSKLFDRSVYGQWEADGSIKFSQRLRSLTLKKMAHRPEALAHEIIQELDKMQASWS